MKKALVLILAAVFVLAMTSVAYAADPAEDTPYTFIEAEPGRTANPPDQPVPANVTPLPFGNLSGASAWAYKDASDWAKMYGTATKYEGSYAPFGYAAANLYDFDTTGRDRGPHGGYGAGSNKCKVCHAVHRADGAYMLLRVDNADDACSYCHIGDHRHSVVSAYWASGNSIYPSNGHTIGSGKDIPDSTTWQWREAKEFSNLNNQTGEEETQIIHVRRYLSTRVKLMNWGSGKRRGPTFLRCMSCHQVHNASDLIWRPYASTWAAMTDGYKLLRNNPSGLNKVNPVDIDPVTGMINEASLDPQTRARLDNTALLSGTRLPVAAIDSTYTGQGVVTGYFQNVPTLGFGSPNTTGYSTVYNPMFVWQPANLVPRVEEATLVYWCANCHNLNIAGKEEVEPNWGAGANGDIMLSDRSHVIPIIEEVDQTEWAVVNGFSCYDCHNNDMSRTQTSGTYADYHGTGVTVVIGNPQKQCGPCHVSEELYRTYKQTYRTYLGVAGGNSLSDFPHSGSDAGFKLLNDVNPLGPITGRNNPAMHTPFRPAAGDGLDKVCGICHLPTSGSHATGIVK